jgi:hypothetical protein
MLTNIVIRLFVGHAKQTVIQLAPCGTMFNPFVLGAEIF